MELVGFIVVSLTCVSKNQPLPQILAFKRRAPFLISLATESSKTTPMNNEETIQEMRNFYDQAEEYADLACKHLALPTTIETKPALDEVGELRSLVAKIAFVNPLGFTHSIYFRKFVVHFLFPNLSDQERLLIEHASLEAEEVSDRKQWAATAKALEGFERKLTEVQIALIDSMFCNPYSDVDYRH